MQQESGNIRRFHCPHNNASIKCYHAGVITGYRLLIRCDCLKVSELMFCICMYRKHYPTIILFNELNSFRTDQMSAFASKAGIDELLRTNSI